MIVKDTEMMRINFNVDREVSKALKQVSLQRDETVSQILRKLIREVLLKENLLEAVRRISVEGENQ